MSHQNQISALRRVRGVSQQELADAIGTTISTIGKLERGERRLNQDWMEKIAAVLKCEPHMLIQKDGGTATKSDHAPTRDASVDDGVVEIVSLDLSLSMGPGTLIEDFVEENPIKWDMGLLRVITRSPFHVLREVKGIGDSMEPTLRSSDRVLIDTSEKMLSRMHGIYWIDHLGAHGLKRLRAAGQGRILIMSDNPHVPDYEVDAEEMRIHGRALWVGRDL